VADILLSCTEVALLTCHASVVLCPNATLAGVAAKLLMTGIDWVPVPLPPQLPRKSARQRKAHAAKLARIRSNRTAAIISANCKGSLAIAPGAQVRASNRGPQTAHLWLAGVIGALTSAHGDLPCGIPRQARFWFAGVYISHLVKPHLASQKSPNPFRLLSLHTLYVQIGIPKNILFANYSPLGS